MKKILAFALSAVMALALLAGCGNQTDNNNSSNDNGGDASDTPAASVSGTVSTDGSTSMEKVIGALSESYMAANKDVTVNYNPTGSGAGITAVQEGTCDIGLSSRALKDEEKAAGLKETVLAYDGIAIIVHPDNPVSDLSIEQIAKLYTGEITNWKDVGGSDAEVVLIGREAASGTRDGFESITGTKDKCQYRQELTSTGDVITAVSQNPDASLSGGHQGQREGPECGRRHPQRDHRQGRQLSGAASLRAGDGGGQGPLRCGTVLLRLRHLR